MATRQYIGARYVPKFYDFNGSAEWRSGIAYENLTIVTRNGNSYTSKKPVPSNIGEPENNSEYWAATGLYNEQIEAYRQLVVTVNDRIDDVSQDMTTLDTSVNKRIGELDTSVNKRIGELDTSVNDKIDAITISNYETLDANIVGQNVSTKAVNGCCSDGNNIYMYLASADSDTGELIRFNPDTNVWTSLGSINAKHGNSLAYYDGKIYMCDCFSANDIDTLLNSVTVYDTASGSISVINSIVPLYSFARGEDGWYCITSRGTGSASAICSVLNDDFSAVIRTFSINDFPSRHNISGQGIQCVYGSYMYVLTYEQNQQAIYEYNIEKNELNCVYNLPDFVNGYRVVSELESCCVHNDNFYVVCRTDGLEHSMLGYSVLITSMLHSVVYERKLKSYEGVHHVIDFSTDVDNVNPTNFYSLSECCNYIQSSKTRAGRIILDKNAPGTQVYNNTLGCVLLDLNQKTIPTLVVDDGEIVLANGNVTNLSVHSGLVELRNDCAVGSVTLLHAATLDGFGKAASNMSFITDYVTPVTIKGFTELIFENITLRNMLHVNNCMSKNYTLPSLDSLMFNFNFKYNTYVTFMLGTKVYTQLINGSVNPETNISITANKVTNNGSDASFKVIDAYILPL